MKCQACGPHLCGQEAYFELPLLASLNNHNTLDILIRVFGRHPNLKCKRHSGPLNFGTNQITPPPATTTNSRALSAHRSNTHQLQTEENRPTRAKLSSPHSKLFASVRQDLQGCRTFCRITLCVLVGRIIPLFTLPVKNLRTTSELITTATRQTVTFPRNYRRRQKMQTRVPRREYLFGRERPRFLLVELGNCSFGNCICVSQRF